MICLCYVPRRGGQGHDIVIKRIILMIIIVIIILIVLIVVLMMIVIVVIVAVLLLIIIHSRNDSPAPPEAMGIKVAEAKVAGAPQRRHYTSNHII